MTLTFRRRSEFERVLPRIGFLLIQAVKCGTTSDIARSTGESAGSKESLPEAMRRFIWHRLASNSPTTANSNFAQLMSKQDVLQRYRFPWSIEDCTAILGALRSDRSTFLAFRLFYRWASLKMIPGFTPEISAHLDDFAAPDFETYRSVKLRHQQTSTITSIIQRRFTCPSSCTATTSQYVS